MRFSGSPVKETLPAVFFAFFNCAGFEGGDSLFCKFPSLNFISAYGKHSWERNWSKASDIQFSDGSVVKPDWKGNRFVYGLGIEGTTEKKHTWHASVEQSWGGAFRNDVRVDRPPRRFLPASIWKGRPRSSLREAAGPVLAHSCVSHCRGGCVRSILKSPSLVKTGAERIPQGGPEAPFRFKRAAGEG